MTTSILPRPALHGKASTLGMHSMPQLVKREQPARVVIDLKRCTVDLQGGVHGDHECCFDSAHDTFWAGLVAEQERRKHELARREARRHARRRAFMRLLERRHR